ncbi:flavin reductase family protein [Pedobacter psychrodurus]|uniref:Flavin reductase family protein n=1 Tax=Pedobacter psychrodurus TaxID=2530456 RepID=A0A4R0PWM7_9SPHI|nr:flavin reductase [Pedobacter psychrodurus]TCD26524.1 flavin reductase family protein [Pedobacter psychrodurus]
MDITQQTIQQMDHAHRATLINSLPGYKCLQLVGTTGINGHSNLGLFNSVVHLGASPALLGMVFRPKSADHDTLSNIERTGFYTFNNVTGSFLEQAHQTSARYPSGFSEFVECGLTEFFIAGFDAPFVAESTIRIALTLKEILPIKINGTTLVIGEISYISMNDALIATDGYIDHGKAGTITTTGLDSYFEAQHIARLSYAKPGLPLKRF